MVDNTLINSNNGNSLANLTVSGASNTVVIASNKINDAGGVPDMIECSLNSGLLNGFYSTCGYEEYTHEVTMGSASADNDVIGLVLAAFKDEDGVYGPSGQTQSLTFNLMGEDLVLRQLRIIILTILSHLLMGRVL